MKTALALLATATSLSASAQFDISKMMQQRQAQQAGAQTGQPAAKIEDDNSPFVPNTFTGSYRMEMHMFKKGTEEKHSPMNVTYAFKEDMTAMNTKQNEENGRDVRMVYDLKNKAQYMLMDDGKKKTAIKQHMKKIDMSDDAKKPSDMKITMTEEYKDIDGHRCRKITGDDNEHRGEWWVAQDVPVDMMQLISAMGVNARGHDEYARFGGKGLPMEMIWEKKDGSEKLLMNARDVVIGKADPAFFSMDGYQVTDMTHMPGFGGH